MNLDSYSATSGSDSDRPISRFNDPTVFLKLEVSAVLAGSPMCRWRDVNDTSELQRLAQGLAMPGALTHGV